MQCGSFHVNGGPAVVAGCFKVAGAREQGCSSSGQTTVFGTQSREYAIRISREKYEMMREILNSGFESAEDFSRKSIECGESPGGDMRLNAKSPEDIIRSRFGKESSRLLPVCMKERTP